MMNVDVITLELVKNALNAAAVEMQATVERAAYSQIIREIGDASSSLFDRQGRLIAQATALPIQLAGSSVAVKEVLKVFPRDKMRPGDIFILNNPFNGGSHPPDLILTMPYFIDGELAGFGCNYAHHHDVGGMSPGSIPPLSTEIYQEGILIPPLRLMDAGVLNDTLIAMLLDNVRLPDDLMGDLRAQIAALQVGQERFGEINARFGAGVVPAATDELLARTESAYRAAIMKIPDGSYEFEDYLDDDGFTPGVPIPIHVQVTISGEEIHVDFSKTAKQTRGSLNCPLASSLSAVYAVLKVIVDPHDEIPNNEGVYSSVRVTLPLGSLLNPLRPASVSSRPETQARIANVVMGALAAAVPQRVMAQDAGQMAVAMFSGTHPASGKYFVKLEVGVGGWGGRHASDGPDALDLIVSNLSNTPVEAVEMSFPLRVERYEMLPDSSGAGRHRGGLGIRRDVRALSAIDLAVRGERQSRGPRGFFGGLDGTPAKWILTRAGGEPQTLLCKQAGIEMAPGDVLTTITPGGGGYGPPAERDPELIRDDLLNECISRAAARRDYGPTW
ncbi:MAG: hydantoinase B/oxoprolinase family protein [Betaproteobacteria bacterium]|nr:hydantoinase B/oxoprolinase family protein [Betaproteobacteria bacterium]